jgi:hypothetical protein
MQPTYPQEVRHYCRMCGETFTSSVRKSAHSQLMAHWRTKHGFRGATKCHSNCSFKASYLETLHGRMIHGA